jgi:DNA polymerase-3 subunit beta
VRSIQADEVEIRPQGEVHEIVGGKALFRLNGDDPELFPTIPVLERERGVDVPLERFASLCNRTMFAAAKEMGRYAFNGVLLEIDPGEITLVATDGRRLSLARMEHQTGVGERLSVVVPLKGLLQVQRADAPEDATLRIEVRDSMAAFVLPEAEIVAQLVEGEFPDFRAVLPKETDVPQAVDLDRQELARAIQRASITAGDEGPSVELSFGKDSLKVLSRHEGVGESRSDMEVEYQGDDVDIRFNPGFLGEYLKTMPESRVTFRFKDRASAGLFQTSDDSLYVVMPITS